MGHMKRTLLALATLLGACDAPAEESVPCTERAQRISDSCGQYIEAQALDWRELEACYERSGQQYEELVECGNDDEYTPLECEEMHPIEDCTEYEERMQGHPQVGICLESVRAHYGEPFECEIQPGPTPEDIVDLADGTCLSMEQHQAEKSVRNCYRSGDCDAWCEG